MKRKFGIIGMLFLRKQLSQLGLVLLFLLSGNFLFGATQVYYISLANLVNCSMSCGGGSDYGSSGQGFTWNDALPGGATVSAVSIQFNVGVDCTGGIRQTYLNGVAQGNIVTSTWCSCSSITALQTISATPANYNIGGSNTFSVGSGTLGFCTTASLSGYYAIVTVTYTTLVAYPATVSISVYDRVTNALQQTFVANPTSSLGQIIFIECAECFSQIEKFCMQRFTIAQFSMSNIVLEE